MSYTSTLVLLLHLFTFLMYTAHVHFFTNLDLFCIDNARVIYRKIRYFECKKNYVFKQKVLICESIMVNPHVFLTVQLFGGTVIMMVILKPPITRLVKKRTAFYVIQRFITMCATKNPLLSP